LEPTTFRLETELHDGTVLLVGAEPAAFSCAFQLIEQGIKVSHVYPEPFGLRGSSRDIGLTYPELGEPWERLAHALGTELALEFHQWSKLGIEDLQARLPKLVDRGSRLSVTRTEQEARLVAADAVTRSKPPVLADVRLMSGAAASNYAPIDGANQCSYETHTLSFVPVKALDELSQQLQNEPLYQRRTVPDDEWSEITVVCKGDSATCFDSQGEVARGDLAVVAAGMDTQQLTGKFHNTLVPIIGQAFRSPPLKEKTRSSVVGITASWGYERYRFDQERRLLGCGIDPSRGPETGEGACVDPHTMHRFLQRAKQLFTDFDGSNDSLMQWAVEFTGSCDGLPILGPLNGEPKIQVATGFSTSAWSRGWEAGRQLGYAIGGVGVEGTSSLLARCSTSRFQQRRRAMS
jgi:glycine/D-amino acid oxidase-like deaminating enzyme